MKISHISGPVSLRVLECKQKKHPSFVLFGDWHGTSSGACDCKHTRDCIDLSSKEMLQWLNTLSKPERSIDIYIEGGLQTHKNELMVRSMMEESAMIAEMAKGELIPTLRDKYFACYQREHVNIRKECIAPDLRWHYADPRQWESGAYPLDQIVHEFYTSRALSQLFSDSAAQLTDSELESVIKRAVQSAKSWPLFEFLVQLPIMNEEQDDLLDGVFANYFDETKNPFLQASALNKQREKTVKANWAKILDQTFQWNLTDEMRKGTDFPVEWWVITHEKASRDQIKAVVQAIGNFFQGSGSIAKVRKALKGDMIPYYQRILKNLMGLLFTSVMLDGYFVMRTLKLADSTLISMGIFGETHVQSIAFMLTKAMDWYDLKIDHPMVRHPQSRQPIRCLTVPKFVDWVESKTKKTKSVSKKDSKKDEKPIKKEDKPVKKEEPLKEGKRAWNVTKTDCDKHPDKYTWVRGTGCIYK